MTEEQTTMVLRLAYEDAVAERNRLRDARAFFARQLGPLPAVAGISAVAVGTLAKNIEPWGPGLAVVLLVVLVSVSVVFGSRPAYRKLRTECEKKTTSTGDPETLPGLVGLPDDCEVTPSNWYTAHLKLEQCIYPLLEAQLARERTGLFITQGLFVVIVAVLVLAQLLAR